MKVLHISAQDRGGGGGSFEASYRLHRNMLSAGIDSQMLVLNKSSNDVTVLNATSYSQLLDKIKFYWHKLKRKYLIKRYDFSGYFYIDSQSVVSASSLLKGLSGYPDIIVAHWISGFVTSETLREMNIITGAPILWYFMDMAPMTGGCHYMFECEGYKNQCGSCPQLGTKKGDNDLSHKQWARKFQSVQGANITPVVASSWQREMLLSSSIFAGKSCKTIPLGLNVNVFQPRNQVEARDFLGLPHDRKIIFFGAMNMHEERKGFVYLVNALIELYELLYKYPSLRESILLVSAGKKKHFNELKFPFEHRELGFLSGDVALASAYQASDVFVCPSIEDAGPMMINESILCGTPVVSFDMGIARDLVYTGKTGYRAKLRDSTDMSVGIYEVLKLDDVRYKLMRNNCRNMGLELCHPDVQVRAFSSLCVELVNLNLKIGR